MMVICFHYHYAYMFSILLWLYVCNPMMVICFHINNTWTDISIYHITYKKKIMYSDTIFQYYLQNQVSEF